MRREAATLHENTMTMKSSCTEKTSCQMSARSNRFSSLQILLSYLVDVLDAGFIEIPRYNAQSYGNTSDGEDALHDS